LRARQSRIRKNPPRRRIEGEMTARWRAGTGNTLRV
jgi:hypothetical protein